MKQSRAEALLVLGTVLWSGTFVLVKTSLTSVSPSGFVLLRFTLATVIGLLVWGRTLRLLDRRLLAHSVLLGGLYGMGFVLQSIGLVGSTATTSAFITGTTVVFVPFIYRVVEKRPVSLQNWISTLAVLGGLFLFMSPEVVGISWADLLTLGSAIVWACYIVAIDVLTTSYGEDQGKRNLLVVMQFIVTAIVASLGVLVIDGASLPIQWNQDLVLAVAYCAIAATVITAWIQTNIQRFTHPVRAGVIYALEPLFASMIAIALYGERWTWRQGAGACVLLAAATLPDLIAEWSRRR
ncbi:MAG: DMT family transporter [Bradyrhizobiaceae bacterium]|nr:DMT family transporter [Bradyrhizobiaceae bacterium]